MKHLKFEFEKKSKGDGSIVIEGMANPNTVDRIKERIDPTGWSLENYKKNPIILFDHGKDANFGYLPIGKAAKIEATKEGLFTRAIISKSKNDKISVVRDLVEEGILKTFSVGFDPKDSTKDGDSHVITKSELIEISVVPIPMHQDAIFSLVKRYEKAGNGKACDVAKGLHLRCKGAWVASLLHSRMFELSEQGSFNRDATLRMIQDLSGVPLSKIRDVLAGEVTPVPIDILNAFATVLRLDRDFLINVDKGDVAQALRAEKPKEMETKTMEEKPKKEECKKELESKPVIHQVIVPKEVVENEEAAKTLVSESGYNIDNMSTTDTSYVFTQIPDEEVNTESSMMIDLGHGLQASLCSRTVSDTEETSKAVDEETPDYKKEYEDEMKATEEGVEGNPASWIADEDLWEKAKEISKESYGEVNYPFVMWLYFSRFGGSKKSYEAKAAIPADPSQNMVDENPYLAESRQTNVLLGALIKEVQTLSEKLTGVTENTAAKQEEAERSESEDEEMKSLKNLRFYQAEIDKRLKRIGM